MDAKGVAAAMRRRAGLAHVVGVSTDTLLEWAEVLDPLPKPIVPGAHVRRTSDGKSGVVIAIHNGVAFCARHSPTGLANSSLSTHFNRCLDQLEVI